MGLQMGNFTENDEIKIWETLYKHALNMLTQGLEAMEQIAVIQAMVEEKTPWVFDKKEVNDNDYKIINADYIQHCEKDEYNKKLSYLISENYHKPKSFVDLQFFLFVGMRYYKEFMESNAPFSMVNDLPILLTVDERMCVIFSMIGRQLIFSHKFTIDESRTMASNRTNAKKADEIKHKILETIKKISKSDDSRRTLNGWATEVVKKFNGNISVPSVTSIIKAEFKEKLTKGARAKYHLSELIS